MSQKITLPTGQLKRFHIRIVTGGEAAIQTAVARTSGQALRV